MKKNIKEAYKRKVAYNNEFNKANYKGIAIRLSYSKEANIINWLSNFDNMKEYLVTLITEDMKKKGA